MSFIPALVLGCTALLLMAGCNTQVSRALGGASFASAVASGATVVPPESITRERMSTIGDQISVFVSEQGFVPASVQELPVLPNGDLTNFDGWGRQFNLLHEGDLITLTSFGADGRPGGLDEDGDYIATMRVTGRSVEWVTKPDLHARSEAKSF